MKIVVVVVVVRGQTIKLARKPVKKQKENPAGCAGEGEQIKGNIGEDKRMVASDKF